MEFQFDLTVALLPTYAMLQPLKRLRSDDLRDKSLFSTFTSTDALSSDWAMLINFVNKL